MPGLDAESNANGVDGTRSSVATKLPAWMASPRPEPMPAATIQLMNVRDFAERIVRSDHLDDKLLSASSELEDSVPGSAIRIAIPGRPARLSIRPVTDVKVPRLAGMVDPSQRARILHAMANHELQAVELFAWALLAFPDAPADFRRGLLKILGDEQRHTRMYIARIEALGAHFGAFPVSGYFWGKVPSIESPLDFVCAMSLTFENANLDHTLAYAKAARDAGDAKSATVIERVHQDEITHVAFGWRWLEELRGQRSSWQAYGDSLDWPLRAAKASGRDFDRESRRAAGLDEAFIDHLEASREP